MRLELSTGTVCQVALDAIGERYARYRLALPEAERAMRRSLGRYGQLTPVVVCEQAGRLELLDGFKRLAAARGVAGIETLASRQIEADAQTAKVAIYVLNRLAGGTREMEEAWIVHALVREDGLQQQKVAELLGRHKSWVCRRLALIERLDGRVQADLQLGLLTPTAARAVSRLPGATRSKWSS